MPRPGVIVTTREAPPSSGPPIRTGTAFIVGEAEKGAAGYHKIESMADFVRFFGDRVSYSYLYDACDVFFREGGGSAYVSRVTGPGAAEATADLEDASSPTLTVLALGAGEWGNDLRITVAVSGGVTTLTVKNSAGDTLESFATSDGKTGLLEYSGFRYISLEEAHVGGDDPVAVAGVALTGGVQDLGNVDEEDYAEALDYFTSSLGPGQVLAPGADAAPIHLALLTHASTHNRVALLDAPNSTVVGTLEAAAQSARDDGEVTYGAMFASYVKVPGFASGTARTVPYSAVQAGLEARRDRLDSQNVPAAGRRWPSAYATSLVVDFSDEDRETLLLAGVNTARNVGGVIETYAYRSLADPDVASSANWLQLNYIRLRMAITAKGEDVGESYVFAQLDGKGQKLSEFGSAIAGMLLGFYVLGSLYGSTPDEAFRVDTGPSINTPETIAAGELHCVAAVRMSPHAELVVIEFVKTPITQAV
jgi:hypothetical protein